MTSDMERLLLAMLNGETPDIKPNSRNEFLLLELCKNGFSNPGSGGTSVQTDWNQTDETAPDFIKNKTHYYFEKVLFEEATVTIEDGMFAIETTAVPAIGTTVNCTYNGIKYTLEVFDFNGFVAIGNSSAMGGVDNGVPFFAGWQTGTGCIFLVNETSGNVTVKMTGLDSVKLPNNFYDRYTVFYTDGEWIYLDGMCNQKATAQAVTSAISNGPVMINNGGQVFSQPSEFLVVPATNGTYIACQVFSNLGSDNTIERSLIFTTEYVPESTT